MSDNQNPTSINDLPSGQIKASEAVNLNQLSNDDVVGLMVNWHIEACNNVQHVLDMPLYVPDTENVSIAVDIAVLNADGDVIMRPLSPDEVPAFKAGIQYMVDQFATLPFNYVLTDADGKPTCGTDVKSESQDSIQV